MTRAGLRRLVAPAVFGAFDGATSLVGVMLSLAGHPEQVVPAALGLAIAGGVGMAAGSWLAGDDSKSGRLEALAIGAATAVGAILPALPYLVLTGAWAMLASALVLVALGAVITTVRARSQSWLRAAAETYGVLIAVCVAVVACVLALPGSAG